MFSSAGGRHGEVDEGQEEAERGRHPHLKGHHRIREEDDKHDLPHALGGHPARVYPEAGRGRRGGDRRRRPAARRGEATVAHQALLGRAQGQPHAAERRAEEQHGVADPHQVCILEIQTKTN